MANFARDRAEKSCVVWNESRRMNISFDFADLKDRKFCESLCYENIKVMEM